MAKLDKIVNESNRFINVTENDLLKSTKASEKYVYEALMEVFKNVNITNGKLSSTPKAEDFLASLDGRVFDALKKSKYGDAVSSFVGAYDTVGQNVIQIHSALGNGELLTSQINPIKRLEIQKTIANLTEQGMYKDFINPVREGLYRNIMLGASVEDAEILIRDYVKTNSDKKSNLLKYVGQVAGDSIRQFDGVINQTAKINLGLNGTKYVGSLIDDSRAQCIKWIDMGTITDEELQAEIDFATQQQVYLGKKCSGMIPGTNTATFCINRGGYRCRHRAFPIRLLGK